MYKNGILEFFNHPEGIVEKEADGYKYIYQFKDHLGNIRLSYKDADKDGTITQNEIVQEKNYYPFGLQHKGYNFAVNGRKHQYKYNGKEFEENLGLNWYDYGARRYDPAIGRWFVNDNLADDEMQIDKSPYAYSWNSPISLNDPDGNCPWCIGALVGAVTEYAVQATINLAKGQNLGDALWNNIDGVDVLVAAGEGALTSGASAVRRVAITAGAEVVKAAVDYNGNGNFDIAVVGQGKGLTVTGESQKTAKGIAIDTAIGIAGAEGSNKIDNVIKNSSNAAVKSTKSIVTATSKNLDKANNVTRNGTKSARNFKGKSSNEAFKGFSAAKQSQDIANGVNSNLNSIRVGTGTVEGSASSNLAEKAQKTIKSEDEQN
ncbi:RHS repeat domain-containing protein [Aquimarina sp. AU58]|uniref:RHS repeat domain-containing protein n=1 Tax=Aquimarina sp. AU58 TaxID=1874112 RepID=UPI00135A6176|nr:RHS repeat-associated core domain-containing protein [Aquimarina sp. AU58]